MKRAPLPVLLALLSVAVFLSFSSGLNGEFQFDDDIFIRENPNLGDIAYPFRTNPWTLLAGNRTLTQVTFTLNYLVNGYNVMGYHLVNIFLHLAATVLVYLVLRRVLKGIGENGEGGRTGTMALVGAAVFALHPIQTQAVTYIVQRSEVLASLLYAASLLLMIRSVEEKRGKALGYWIMAMVCFVLGWASKEIIVTMPVMFFLYAVYFMDRGAVKKSLAGIAPVLVVGVVLGVRLVAGFQGSEHVGFDMEGLGQREYLYTQFRVLVSYLRLLFIPVGQTIDHDYPVYREFWDPNVVLSFAFWVLVAAASLYSLRVKGKWRGHARVTGFGALWFLVLLSPTSSLVPLKDVIFEHRLYLPMVGIVMCVTAGIDMALVLVKERYGHQLSPRAGAVVILVLLTALGAVTYERNTVWRTKMSLWRDAVVKAPDKSRPHNNLGNCYYLAGDYGSAHQYYKKAMQLDPDNIETYYNMSLTLGKLGYRADSQVFYLLFQEKIKEKEYELQQRKARDAAGR